MNVFLLNKGSVYNKIINKLKPFAKERKINKQNFFKVLDKNFKNNFLVIQDLKKIDNMWDLFQIYLKHAFKYKYSINPHISNFSVYFLKEKYGGMIEYFDLLDSDARPYDKEFCFKFEEWYGNFGVPEGNFLYAICHKYSVKIEGEEKFFKSKIKDKIKIIKKI
jgi:hypothetical protein